MYTHSKLIILVAVMLMWLFQGLALAQVSTTPESSDWQALDEDFRQALIEEVSARRGLNSNDQNPDWLIRSAADIREVLRVSCDLSGACADESGRSTLGENLVNFPEYDEQQGLRNSEALLRMKMGYED